MAISKFIGGPWHGRVFDVSKEVVVFLVTRNDRHPKQVRGFFQEIRYRRVKPGVYRFVDGYYPLPRYVDQETAKALAEQQRVSNIVQRIFSQATTSANPVADAALPAPTYETIRALYDRLLRPLYEIHLSKYIPERGDDGEWFCLSMPAGSWLTSFTNAEKVLLMHPNTLEALREMGADMSGITIRNWSVG